MSAYVLKHLQSSNYNVFFGWMVASMPVVSLFFNNSQNRLNSREPETFLEGGGLICWMILFKSFNIIRNLSDYLRKKAESCNYTVQLGAV